MIIDIQPDSPVSIHEQIITQVIAGVAAGTLKPGARIPGARELAQKLVIHPDAVARAYQELEWLGVVKAGADREAEVTADAAVVCRIQRQEAARRRVREAVREALASGLADQAVRTVVEDELARPTGRGVPRSSAHEAGDRDSQAIQALPPQDGRGPAQPDRPPGGHFRAAGR
jgi:GntR family transcriptional regulator